METRANYILIGSFTLLGILGSLVFFLWLAKVEVDRRYAYYDILFEHVSGLSEAGDVRFNGLPVGQVIRMALDREDPSRVRVRIEIQADTPVKTDTVATLELMGVTGVSYVDLTGGSADAERPVAAAGEDVPVITSRRSAVQSLFMGGPELLEKAIALLDKLNSTVGPENQAAFGNVLANLESVSGELDTTLKDFSALSADLSTAASKVGDFTERLDPVAEAATTTMTTADETLRTAHAAIERAQGAIDEATGALASARQTFDAANGLISDELPGLVDQVQSTAGTIENVVADIGGKAGGVTEKIDRVSELAIARLDDAEATFAKLNTAIDAATVMMTSVDQTSQSINTLIVGEGTALVAETRSAVAAANEAITAAGRIVAEDLPVIVADIRSATATVDAVVTEVGADLTSLSDKLDGIAGNADAAIVTATATFRNANETLAAITTTMDAATGTLGTAKQTFAGVNRLIDEDVGVLVGDIRGAIGSLDTALVQVAADLPEITAEVRQTLQRTSRFVDSMNGIVNDNSEEIEVFMQAGLPQFVRFVKEASLLVASLQRLTAKIERDPVRFLLGTQSSEFGR